MSLKNPSLACLVPFIYIDWIYQVTLIRDHNFNQSMSWEEPVFLKCCTLSVHLLSRLHFSREKYTDYNNKLFDSEQIDPIHFQFNTMNMLKWNKSLSILKDRVSDGQSLTQIIQIKFHLGLQYVKLENAVFCMEFSS